MFTCYGTFGDLLDIVTADAGITDVNQNKVIISIHDNAEFNNAGTRVKLDVFLSAMQSITDQPFVLIEIFDQHMTKMSASATADDPGGKSTTSHT